MRISLIGVPSSGQPTVGTGTSTYTLKPPKFRVEILFSVSVGRETNYALTYSQKNYKLAYFNSRNI